MENKSCCSICLTNIRKNSQRKTLTCNHSFHMKCIWKWLVKTSTCPLCRESANITPEYDCPYNEYIHFVNACVNKNKTTT